MLLSLLTFAIERCREKSSGDDVININDVSGNYLALGGGNDKAILLSMSYGGENIIIGESINYYDKSSFSNDCIYGMDGDDQIRLDGGNNTIYGSFGKDLMYRGSDSPIQISPIFMASSSLDQVSPVPQPPNYPYWFNIFALGPQPEPPDIYL